MKRSSFIKHPSDAAVRCAICKSNLNGTSILKVTEKNVGIPSKSPWKSSNSPCQRTTEIIRPFLFRPFIQVVPPQLWCLAIHTKSHWKMFPPQKLTIFNKIGREHPWDLTDSGRWLEDVRFDHFCCYQICDLVESFTTRTTRKNFDQSKSIFMYHVIFTRDLII